MKEGVKNLFDQRRFDLLALGRPSKKVIMTGVGYPSG